MPKKKDLPAMPFYIGDWRKDPGVLALDRYQKSLWFDIICLMWESEERGYLTFNNDKIPINLLANMLNENVNDLEKNLIFFEQLNLFSRDKKGRIYSRKIINIIQLSDKRRLAGLVSAQQRAQQMVSKNLTKPPTITETETETLIEDISSNLKDINGNEFELFWEKYHAQSGIPKENKKEAIKHWNKLKKTEKDKAYSSIRCFIDTRPIGRDGTKYIDKARSYLSGKLFNNEFKPKINPKFESELNYVD